MPKVSKIGGATHSGVTVPNRVLRLTDTDVVLDGALYHSGSALGFYGTDPIAKPTVEGARNDGEGALADLITTFVNLGVLLDSTTATGAP